MKLFDSKEHAKILDSLIEKRVGELTASKTGVKTLALVQIGNNLSSEKYVNLKVKLCEKYGIPYKKLFIASHEGDNVIFQKVEAFFMDKSVGGGIIQMPLPRESLKEVLNLIPVNKDLDLLSSTSQSQFYSNNFAKLPPVVRALNYFLKAEDINLHTNRVFVVGEGFLVGKPICHYLRNLGADVQVLTNYKRGTPLDCQLLVLSAGVPKLVNGRDIASGCNIVDFGSTVVDGTIIGDFDILSPMEHLAAVSTSPGGLGPLVVRYLIMNHLDI